MSEPGQVLVKDKENCTVMVQDVNFAGVRWKIQGTFWLFLHLSSRHKISLKQKA